MSLRQETNAIVLHHTLTQGDVSVDTINDWHVTRGFSSIGYHFVINKDGSIHEGRPVLEVGAHTKGFNADTIGIALCGDFSVQVPTPQQLEALLDVIYMLDDVFELGILEEDVSWFDAVQYHRDDSEENPCPGALFIKAWEKYVQFR